MQLETFIENPDNPSVGTVEQIQRLKEKIKRVPGGLTAMRIAYVTDMIEGKKVVISGNKRLRVLKLIYTEKQEVPDEWFQDVTSMSQAERHEFIVTANVNDGQWDLDKLLSQYEVGLLSSYGMDDVLSKIPGHTFDNIENLWVAAQPTEETKEDTTDEKIEDSKPKTHICIHCGKEFELSCN